jgi:hypothetical protein
LNSAVDVVSRFALFAIDNCSFSPANCDADAHVCNTCRKYGLLKEAKEYSASCSKEKEDNNNKRSIVEDFIKFEADISLILHSLKDVKLRECDIVNAVWMFDTVIKKHNQCCTFVLLRNNLKFVFLVCLIIAHKVSADITYQNVVFVDLLRNNNIKLSLNLVGEFERTVLYLLDYDLSGCINAEKYNEFARILSGTEIVFDDVR